MVAGERKLGGQSIGPAAGAESATDEGDVSRAIEIALRSDPDRTLMEILLDAAFGAQCRRNEMLASSERCAAVPVFRSRSLPLGELLARGYSIRCKIEERREE